MQISDAGTATVGSTDNTSQAHEGWSSRFAFIMASLAIAAMEASGLLRPRRPISTSAINIGVPMAKTQTSIEKDDSFFYAVLHTRGNNATG